MDTWAQWDEACPSRKWWRLRHHRTFQEVLEFSKSAASFRSPGRGEEPLLIPRSMTVNLGPAEAAVYPLPPANPRADGLGKNPRCLRRDMSNKMTSRYHRPELITSLITDSPDIATFQSVLQHPATSATPGVHGTGHFTIGGDPGADLYASPGDPAFWLHHAMVDRVWAIWQAQDMEARTKVVAGVTIMRNESSPAATLDDKIDLGVLEDKVYKARDLLSTVDGPFCYTYE